MLITRLGIPHIRGASSFIVAMFIDALGSGLFVPFSLLYFHTVASLPLQVVGIMLTIAAILTLPMSLVTGILIDRIGTRRILVASELLLAAGFFGYLLVRTVPGLFAAALIATSGDRMFWVAQPTMIAEIAGPGEQDRWYGLVGSVRMAGLSIGGLLAGFIIATGSVIAFQVLAGIDVLSFLVVFVLFLPLLRGRNRHSIKRLKNSGYGLIIRDRPFIGLVISNIAFIFCIFMLTTALPVYAVEALRAPAWIVGFVLALNTLLMAGGQTFTVRLLEPHRRTRVLVAAGLVWSSACSLLALALIVPRLLLVPYLITVVILYTFAELMHAPTANALAAQAGPSGLRGRYVAVYQFSWGIGIALTPALFTLLFTRGPALPWLVLTGLSLVATLVIYQIEGRLPAQAIRMAISQTSPSTIDSNKS
ncbi:MAG: MFS transporter [Ktedonobacteraceae bacterium]